MPHLCRIIYVVSSPISTIYHESSCDCTHLNTRTHPPHGVCLVLHYEYVLILIMIRVGDIFSDLPTIDGVIFLYSTIHLDVARLFSYQYFVTFGGLVLPLKLFVLSPCVLCQKHLCIDGVLPLCQYHWLRDLDFRIPYWW